MLKLWKSLKLMHWDLSSLLNWLLKNAQCNIMHHAPWSGRVLLSLSLYARMRRVKGRKKQENFTEPDPASTLMPLGA